MQNTHDFTSDLINPANVIKEMCVTIYVLNVPRNAHLEFILLHVQCQYRLGYRLIVSPITSVKVILEVFPDPKLKIYQLNFKSLYPYTACRLSEF